MTWPQWLVAAWLAFGLYATVSRAVRFSVDHTEAVVIVFVGMIVQGALVVVLHCGGFW